MVARQSCGLRVIPLADGNSLGTLEFFERIHPALGAATGRYVAFRQFGHPNKNDKVYKDFRSPELKKRDGADVEVYVQDLKWVGGDPKFWLIEKLAEAAAHFRIPDDQLPVLIVTPLANRSLNIVVRLPGELGTSRVHDTEATRVLIQGLAEETILKLDPKALFTSASREQELRAHLRGLESRLHEVYEISPRFRYRDTIWCVRSPDGSPKEISASEYGDLVRRSDWDLLLNEMTQKLHTGGVEATLPQSSFDVLKEVIERRWGITPGESCAPINGKGLSKDPGQRFQKASKKLRDWQGRALLTTRKIPGGSLYQFAPPPDLNYCLILNLQESTARTS